MAGNHRTTARNLLRHYGHDIEGMATLADRDQPFPDTGPAVVPTHALVVCLFELLPVLVKFLQNVCVEELQEKENMAITLGIKMPEGLDSLTRVEKTKLCRELLSEWALRNYYNLLVAVTERPDSNLSTAVDDQGKSLLDRFLETVYRPVDLKPNSLELMLFQSISKIINGESQGANLKDDLVHRLLEGKVANFGKALEVIEDLCCSRVRLRVLANHRDDNGFTPLMRAALDGKSQPIRDIFKIGGDLYAINPDYHGCNTLMCATVQMGVKFSDTGKGSPTSRTYLVFKAIFECLETTSTQRPRRPWWNTNADGDYCDPLRLTNKINGEVTRYNARPYWGPFNPCPLLGDERKRSYDSLYFNEDAIHLMQGVDHPNSDIDPSACAGPNSTYPGNASIRTTIEGLYHFVKGNQLGGFTFIPSFHEQHILTNTYTNIIPKDLPSIRNAKAKTAEKRKKKAASEKYKKFVAMEEQFDNFLEHKDGFYRYLQELKEKDQIDPSVDQGKQRKKRKRKQL